jgi:hypothetical protein
LEELVTDLVGTLHAGLQLGLDRLMRRGRQPPAAAHQPIE